MMSTLRVSVHHYKARVVDYMYVFRLTYECLSLGGVEGGGVVGSLSYVLCFTYARGLTFMW